MVGDDDIDVMHSSAEAPGVRGPALTGRQRSVREALARENAEVAQMYLGAIWVLDQPGNPERFGQAAHSLREVIEKLGERVGAPIGGGPSLKEEVRKLDSSWRKVCLPGDFEAGESLGALSKQLKSFLKAVSEFFKQFHDHDITRREELAQFFAVVKPSRRRLPAQIERRKTKAWLDTRDTLIAISHHRKTTTDNKFGRLLERVDLLILDRLHLPTFERFDEIDWIIAEGEGQT